MNDYQINNWFPVPIYATIFADYNQQEMIDNLESPLNPEDPNYFGDSLDVQQIHNKECFSWLNKQVKHHTRTYLDQLGVSKNCNIVVQKSWSVILSNGGWVKPHIHPNSHFSCVFYLKTSGGKIKFYRGDHPLKNLPLDYDIDTCYNYENCTYEPQDGMLLLFPSTLKHEVETFYGEDKRYSITYDLLLTTDSPRENTLLNPNHWLTL